MCHNYLNLELLKGKPKMNNTAQKWISGIDKNSSYKNYIDWLNRVISGLETKDRIDIVSRMISQSDIDWHGAIGELVYAAFWKHLKWKFKKDPMLKKKTPDYDVIFDAINNRSFIGEISVITHNHPHQNTELLGSRQILVDGKPANKSPTITKFIDQVHRFATKLGQKYEKYMDILDNRPFVICFYITGNDVYNDICLGDFQINKALWGNYNFSFSDGQTSFQPTVTKSQHDQNEYNGILVHDKFRKLSAVIVCREKWHSTITPNVEESGHLAELKAYYSFSISINPFGCWPSITDNPFHNASLPVSGLIEENKIKLNEPTSFEFY